MSALSNECLLLNSMYPHLHHCLLSSLHIQLKPTTTTNSSSRAGSTNSSSSRDLGCSTCCCRSLALVMQPQITDRQCQGSNGL